MLRYYADPGASIGIGIVVVTFAARLGEDEIGNEYQYGVDQPADNPAEEDDEPGDGNQDEFQDENQERSQEAGDDFNLKEEHEDPADPYNEENGEQEPSNEDSWDDIPIEDTVNPQSENAEPSDDMNQPEETTEELGYGESNDTLSDPNSWENGEESEQVMSEEISPDASIESTPDNEEQKQAQQIVQAVENNNLGPEGDGVANLIKRAKMALIF
ncbi:hypothetical protein HYALB_00000032 [Hymenoscyphus albidus]|uniref:Uncharacterized protein n=1 Tax=Hymenoscyphus albidus TaxID=595503 RepID=A0A9N9LIM7_9HELO|nr:hypothetical protein HYALB_00000032 [Hymenoscyphus albidus]